MQIVDSTSALVPIVLFPFKELKKILTYHVTYNRYRQLNEEVNGLKSQLIRREELLRENARLKELLNLKSTSSYRSVAARVIGRDPSSWSSVIIINRGRENGISQGMAVVNAQGIVGRVVEVNAVTSKAVLLNDTNFSVAAEIQRNREAGVVVGTLQGICRMRYLAPEADIKPGDQVITSRLSSFFPEGLLIGKVIAIEDSQSSPTRECLIRPAVFPSQVEEVLVIKK